MPDDPFKTHDPPKTGPPQKLGKTVLEDLNQMDFRRTMHEDLQEIYQFYLDAETRDRLNEMDQISRWLHLTGWLVKNSLLKLTPVRRLLLLAGMVLFAWGLLDSPPGLIMGFLLVVFTLLLELKDKLLAQDELMTGRAVQFALMPREDPTLPGWETWLFTRPANEVGGDLVDYLEIDENRLGLALGDVAGKGLGAAMFMAKLQSTLRAIAPNFDTLSDLGAAVNQIFIRDGLPGRFVSLIYLELTPEDGRVRLLNAGHLPPLVVHADSLEEMPKGAPALGLMGQAEYSEQHAVLAPGDLMVVFSDGLTEARNEVQMFFGDDRLRALLPSLRNLSAEAVGRRLLQAVEDFSGEARPHDDLSMIVVKRLAAPARLPAPSPAVEDEAPAASPE